MRPEQNFKPWELEDSRAFSFSQGLKFIKEFLDKLWWNSPIFEWIYGQASLEELSQELMEKLLEELEKFMNSRWILGTIHRKIALEISRWIAAKKKKKSRENLVRSFMVQALEFLKGYSKEAPGRFSGVFSERILRKKCGEIYKTFLEEFMGNKNIKDISKKFSGAS